VWIVDLIKNLLRSKVTEPKLWVPGTGFETGVLASVVEGLQKCIKLINLVNNFGDVAFMLFIFLPDASQTISRPRVAAIRKDTGEKVAAQLLSLAFMIYFVLVETAGERRGSLPLLTPSDGVTSPAITSGAS